MGGSVCRQVCKRQTESGDALDALADAPRSLGRQLPALVESPEECFLSRQSTATSLDVFADAPRSRGLQVSSPAASPEECFLSRQSTAASELTLASAEECESSDVVSKGLEQSSEPEEGNTPLFPIHELYYEQVCPMVGPPDTAAKLLPEDDASVPPSDGSSLEEETTRDHTAEQKGADVQNTPSWSLGGSPAQADADADLLSPPAIAQSARPVGAAPAATPTPVVEATVHSAKAESAQDQKEGSSESAAQKETKEEIEELPTESPVEALQETPREAPEEETTTDNTAEEKGAEVEIASSWSLSGSASQVSAKAEAAEGEEEGNNEEEKKEVMEELPSESLVGTLQETTKEAPEEETTRDNTAEEKGAEADNASSWSLSGSAPHVSAKAEAAQGKEEENNESAAKKEEKEYNGGCKELAVQNETEEEEDPVSESPSLSAWVASVGADTSAFGTAWSAGLTGLGLAEMTKVGKVIHAMKDAGYSDEKANTVCKALFCKQSEEELKQAFEVFDEGKTGAIAGAEFGKLLKLLGEDVPPEKVDDAFKEVDTNNSGKLEYAEFCAVVRFLNPKSAPETGSSFLLFGTWWTQQEVQQEAKQEAKQEEPQNDGKAGNKADNIVWW